jgi:uncharacterized membrane protein
MIPPRKALSYVCRALLWSAAALYPVAVYIGLKTGHLTIAALLLAAIALWRCLSRPCRGALLLGLIVLALAACAILAGDSLPLKFYPVAMSAAFFLAFARSLFSTPLIEKFARLKEKDLPPQAVAYCRKVTVAWCVFLAVNGLIALDSALFRSDAWWTLYNGLISYILMGCMFAGEFLIRMAARRSGS